MYHRVRRKMVFHVCAIILLNFHNTLALPKTLDSTETAIGTLPVEENYENNVINFDEEYSVKFNNKYGTIPWDSNDKLAKEFHKYTVVKDEVDVKNNTNVKTNETILEITTTTTNPTTIHKYTVVTDELDVKNNTNPKNNETTPETTITTANPIEGTETTAETEYSVIPLELISTTENSLVSIVESTTEDELLVIPLFTTLKDLPTIEINQAVTLPTSTIETEVTTEEVLTTTSVDYTTTTFKVQTRYNASIANYTVSEAVILSNTSKEFNKTIKLDTTLKSVIRKSDEISEIVSSEDTSELNGTDIRINRTINEDIVTTTSNKTENITRIIHNSEEVNDNDVPLFTELDSDDEEVPEDYYDAKDVVPTTAPKVNAISVLVGLAGSVVESVAERVVPKGIYDLFKRMQKQNEALEAERLRSREENGGLGQFGRGILKSISSGLGKPLSQLMAGVRDIGSLDTDRGFVSNLASGVSSVASVANSLVDTFKDRVQAIYPGTVWCGDGRSATARSGELGLFFFTDTCCRQHDACKLFIRAGETKYGLTNTGLFTRSHCSCDDKFRSCLQRTNSLVSGQIGLTYFNVLGPQCFRKAHPIVKCARRTRITGQKCEEYELDYTKPKMWQWFDNETF